MNQGLELVDLTLYLSQLPVILRSHDKLVSVEEHFKHNVENLLSMGF